MGKGKGKAGTHSPLRVKNKSPPLQQKMGTYHKKIITYSTLNPLFLAIFTVHVSSSNQTDYFIVHLYAYTFLSFELYLLQTVKLHCSFLFFPPVHFSPPPDGRGLSQYLTCNWSPFPQSLLQLPFFIHSPQFPSTVLKKMCSTESKKGYVFTSGKITSCHVTRNRSLAAILIIHHVQLPLSTAGGPVPLSAALSLLVKVEGMVLRTSPLCKEKLQEEAFLCLFLSIPVKLCRAHTALGHFWPSSQHLGPSVSKMLVSFPLLLFLQEGTLKSVLQQLLFLS